MLGRLRVLSGALGNAPCRAWNHVRLFGAPPDYDEQLDVNTYHKLSDIALTAVEDGVEVLEDLEIQGFDLVLSV